MCRETEKKRQNKKNEKKKRKEGTEKKRNKALREVQFPLLLRDMT